MVGVRKKASEFDSDAFFVEGFENGADKVFAQSFCGAQFQIVVQYLLIALRLNDRFIVRMLPLPNLSGDVHPLLNERE